jgi:hypothetical protein
MHLNTIDKIQYELQNDGKLDFINYSLDTFNLGSGKSYLHDWLTLQLQLFTPSLKNVITGDPVLTSRFLNHFGLHYSKANEEKLDDHFQRITNQINQIQDYLVKSPPTFHVYYSISSYFGSSFVGKIVTYSYTQVREKK